MKKLFPRLLTLALISGVLSCRYTTPKQDTPPPQPAPPPVEEPPKAELPVPPQQPPKTGIEAQDENWKKIAEEAARGRGLEDQQAIAESEAFLREAAAYKNKGDFEKAQDMAQKAVERWPQNIEARKLLAEINEVIIGRNERWGAPAEADARLAEFKVRIEQAQIEITNHIRNGERFYNARMFVDAAQEFEEARFKIRSIPYEVKTMADLLPKVEEYIRRSKNEADSEKSRLDTEKRRMAEAEAEAHALAEKREVIEKIANLLELAYVAFDTRKFDKCIRICDEILEIDPHYTVALEIKEDAGRARHRNEYHDFLRRKVEAWKELTRSDQEAVIPYSETVRFPSREEWAIISKRRSEAIIKTGAEGATEDPEILAIHRKLETMKIDMGFENHKLEDIIAFIRDFTGLNFYIDKSESVTTKVDLEKQIPFKVKDLVLKNVLKLLLSQFGLDYQITPDKVIKITTPDLAGGEPLQELHDIRDIMVKIQDFGGPKVELQSPSGGGGTALSGATFTLEEPKESSVSQEQIVELIKENIAPGTWEGGNYSIEMTPNQQLLVTHTLKTHQEMREFLAKLRSFTGTMVSITTRFVAAYDDFLDDVGVDLIRRPPAAGFDVAGGAGTTVDEATGELGPGFVVNEAASLESYDLRAQTFHTLLRREPQTGIQVDPFSGRLVNQGGLGIQYQWIGEQALQSVIRAMHKNQRATIVQAPRLTVFNTQRSHLMVLTQRAYIQDLEPQISTLAAAYDPVIGTLVQGVVLDVRPIVSNDRKYVTLELRPSLAELQALRAIDIVTGNTAQAGSNVNPVLQLPWMILQKAETTVSVPDRGTLLVSGFKDIQTIDGFSGVPFLEHIPGLSFFFSRKATLNEHRRLLILVTPEIIDLSEHEERQY